MSAPEDPTRGGVAVHVNTHPPGFFDTLAAAWSEIPTRECFDTPLFVALRMPARHGQSLRVQALAASLAEPGDHACDFMIADDWSTPRAFVDRALREVTRGTLYENDRAVERRTWPETKPLEIRARVSLATLLSLNG